MRRLYFPSEGRHAEDFFARKNSGGFELTNSGTRDQHANHQPTVAAPLVRLQFYAPQQQKSKDDNGSGGGKNKNKQKTKTTTTTNDDDDSQHVHRRAELEI
jgi:hypothetical protein